MRVLPSITRFGVLVIAGFVHAVGTLIGHDRIRRLVLRLPLPLLAEYPRLVRSLGFAYIWETWPDTDVDGGDPTGASVRVSTHHDCDVLVVGSGAGGATTAAVLAEAGHDVLIVEEGPWVEQGSVVPFSLEQMDHQYRSGGVTVALGRPVDRLHRGPLRRRRHRGQQRALLGVRPRRRSTRWRRSTAIQDFATDDVLSICDEVEASLSVQTVPGRHTPASDILRRGADRLGWQTRRDPAVDDVPGRCRRRPRDNARA